MRLSKPRMRLSNKNLAQLRHWAT